MREAHVLPRALPPSRRAAVQQRRLRGAEIEVLLPPLQSGNCAKSVCDSEHQCCHEGVPKDIPQLRLRSGCTSGEGWKRGCAPDTRETAPADDS